MLRSKTIAAAAVAALAGSALVAGPAGAATKELVVKGGTEFVPGVRVSDTQRFAPRELTVKKGDKIQIVNRTRHEHTVSVVKRRHLPNSFEDLGRRVFRKFESAHGVPQGDGPPAFFELDGFTPVAEDNPLIFNEPGDSIVFGPQRRGPRLDIGGSAGSNLFYLCLIHPWMQGKIEVR